MSRYYKRNYTNIVNNMMHIHLFDFYQSFSGHETFITYQKLIQLKTKSLPTEIKHKIDKNIHIFKQMMFIFRISMAQSHKIS